MSINLASILSRKFSWAVFGHPIDINVGSSPGLVTSLGAPSGSVLTLVSVKCVRADDYCFPVSILLILPGPGTAVSPADKCCCQEDGLMMWDVLPESKLPALHTASISLSQLMSASKGKLGTLGASLTFGNVQLNGSVISGEIRAMWTENIAGIDITLLDGTYPVSFDFGVQNPYSITLVEFDVSIIHVTVNANLSVGLNPNKFCAELRANWTSLFGGGNVQGPHGCVGF